jgi:hypothetical protein
MRKLTKITLAILTSFAVSTISFAGELTVTGNAKATYTILSSESTLGTTSGGKGIGIANEFSLGASGELDNGITWAYAQDIDGATVQDDAKITLTSDAFGTVGIFVSEGGLSSKYKFDASAYGAGSDNGYSGGSGKHDAGATGAAFTYGDDIGGFNNFQYHTPAGLLPFEIQGKFAYAPNTGANANASSHSVGALPTTEDGNTAMQGQISAAPIDGLSLSVSYMEKEGESRSAKVQDYQAGGGSIKYSWGPITAGYGKFYVAPALAVQGTGTYVQHYENDAISIGFAVNDAISVSWTDEASESNLQQIIGGAGPATGAATQIDSTIESTVQTAQAAYTAGGMTLSLSLKDVENVDYTNNKDIKETIVAMVLAF